MDDSTLQTDLPTLAGPTDELVREQAVRDTIRTRVALFTDVARAAVAKPNWDLESTLKGRLQDVLLEAVATECEVVAPGAVAADDLLRYPIGRGRVLKLGPTVKNGGWQSLSVIGALAALLHSDGFVQWAAGKRLIDETGKLIKILGEAWQRITDPKELVVVDLLWALRSQTTITDFDALAAGDYDRAFGSPGPTTEDIEAALARVDNLVNLPSDWRGVQPDVLRRDLETTLEGLRARGILEERRGRWHFAL